MNKLTATLAAVAAFAAAPLLAQSAKIVVVDAGKVLNESIEGKKTQEALQKRFAEEEARLKAEQDKLRAQVEDYQKKRESMSPEAQQEREEELNGKVRRFQTGAEQSSRKIEALAGRTNGVLREKLAKFLSEWSKAAGYDLVMLSDATLYYAPSMDATDAALKAFNEEYIKAGQPAVVLPEEAPAEAAPASAPASAPKPASAPAPKTGAAPAKKK